MAKLLDKKSFDKKRPDKKPPEKKTVDPEQRDHLVDDLLNTRCARPFDILGWHRNVFGPGMLLRLWRPDATRLEVYEQSTGQLLGEAEGIAPGLFELVMPNCTATVSYRLLVTNAQQHVFEVLDPYQFEAFCRAEPDIEPYWLFRQLGSHMVSVPLLEKRGSQLSWAEDIGEGVKGVMFRVYAPNARSVSIIGSFNHWDGRFHQMASSDTGIWRLFIPGVKEGELYKFELKNQQGELLPHKADPFEAYAEQAPGNASIVYDPGGYDWQSRGWHSHSGMDRPVSIYEVHLGSWKKKDGAVLSYRELARQLIPYVKTMGFTHIECLPVHEHPFTGSWGYQPVGLYAATSRYGTPDDFKAFIDQCHHEGIGVILDWVPAHFPSDSHGLARFDGTAIYEYEDPRRGWHPDWQTFIYDYGRPEVRHYLISNALYWFEQFHVDGLRVDAVASMLYLDYSRNEGEWEPNILGGNEHLEAVEFIKELNEAVYLHFPDCMMIAEESTSWPDVSQPTYDNGLGFGYKWNMGWMHDSLAYIARYPEHRCYHHDQILFSMVYFYSEHFILALSHDEVVHGKGSLLGKMPGDEWQQYANLRAYYGFMYGHPGKKLLFMGAEIGSRKEWNHDSELDWLLLHNSAYAQGLNRMVRELNGCYQSSPALWRSDYHPEGFHWLIIDDRDQSVFAFCRTSCEAQPVVVICNMTPVVRPHYRVGVPVAGRWREIFNTDRVEYQGSGVTNEDIDSEGVAMHQQQQSLVLTLPSLATLLLSPDS